MNNIAILDYGIGNLLSVKVALEKCGAAAFITNDPDVVIKADKIVLPGVGAFGSAMQSLIRSNLDSAIINFYTSGKPLLGICLGMQLLFSESDEFVSSNGLDILPGKVSVIIAEDSIGVKKKLPNMGWSQLIKSNVNNNEQSAVSTIMNGEFVYFAHSYMLSSFDISYLTSHIKYGNIEIPAIVQNQNIIGCQFHPEKSGIAGLKLLESFVRK